MISRENQQTKILKPKQINLPKPFEISIKVKKLQIKRTKPNNNKLLHDFQ